MLTDLPQVKRLFMMFHGMYGNQLLDKYRTGQLNKSGEDTGLLSAQAVWVNGLKEFDFDVVRQAVAHCENKHKTFPPTLPEFRDLCKSLVPHKPPTQTDTPRLGMSPELRAEIKARNRQVLAELKLANAGRRDYGTGLPALLLMTAKAIGDAGGDEVKALLSLETTFAQKASHEPARI
jgi:hypothetical protein